MISFKEKNIVVTGAAGFIGSNLTDHLINLGANVIGVDNLFNGRMENLENAKMYKNFQFYKADIRDLDVLLDIFNDIDIIFHEAALTSVPQSIIMPDSYNDVNVKGVLNVLNGARKKDVGKVIFASSAAVYGDNPTLLKKEDMNLIPISPYGVSKLAGEAYMYAFHKVYGLNTTSLRYFNVYGPRQRDSPYSGVMAIWLGRILHDENLVIFGNGENSRDFTYVKDVVEANILAVIHDAPGEILNISCNNPINLTNLAHLFLRLTGRDDLKIEHVEPLLGDILHSYGDISKARELIKFEPKFDQEEGLKDYLQWFSQKYQTNFKHV